MLNILLCKDWTVCRDEILSRIARDVANCKQNVILMVPELNSHDMERRLCASAGDTASRFAEVLSFTRLVTRVQEYCGCGSPQCLDEGGRVIAMAASARQLHSKLKAYAAVETKPEFLRGMVDAVDEFKRCCISPVDLQNASRQSEGAFAQKLEELSLLLETYNSLCSRGKKDPCDVMNWLLDRLQDCDFAEKHSFYIDGFPDFTRQHFAVLEHLIRNAGEVTIGINCDSLHTAALSMEKARDTANQLIQAAEAWNIPVKISRLIPRSTPLQTVTDCLFQGQILENLALKDKLFLYQTDSTFLACRGAAARIAELVRNGCRYRDIGVVCTDLQAYRNVLSLVLRQFRIPCYQAGTDEVLSQSVYHTILSAIETVLGGFEQRDVLRYCKSALSPVPQDSCDLLENYAILWGISGNRWKETWNSHPRGLGEAFSEADTQLLSQINDIRAAAVKPLAELQASFRDAKNLREQMNALYSFLEKIRYAEKLKDLSEAMDQAGNNRAAQILNQLWEILLCSMEQMYDLLGDSAWDSDAFYRLFVLILKQYDVGTIPPVLDSVSFGSISSMRCQQIKHLILLGAEEGKFPGYAGAKGVLSDQERVQLREMGVPLTGGNLEGLQAEFSEIYQVCCGADDSIAMFAPSAQPSYIFRRLAGIIGGAEVFMPREGQCIAGAEDAVAFLARNDAKEAADRLGLWEPYQAVCRKKAHVIGKISTATVQDLYGKRLTLSASQIDKQANCRLAYFLRYGLKAKERKEITIDPAEFGTFVHAVLENTCREIMEKGGFRQVSKDSTLKISRKYAENYAKERFSELDSQRATYLLHRNMQELDAIVRELWTELYHSRFVPVDFEVGFGDGERMPFVAIEECDMDACVRGFVDRVDAWQESGNNYFRVVDYKTGIKDFDYCDIFNGIGLQMLLYMYALEQGGEEILGSWPRPVGIQYFPARMPYLNVPGKLADGIVPKDREETLRRNGLVLADGDVLDAMEPEGSPHRIRFNQKVDGVISGDVMTREQIILLKKFVFHRLRGFVNDIASGNIEPNPYTRGNDHGACMYCEFKEICHSDMVAGRRNYKNVNADRFWQDVEKEVGPLG